MFIEAFAVTGRPDDIRFSAGRWANFSSFCLTVSDDLGRLDPADFIGDEADLYREQLHGEFAPALALAGEAWAMVAAALSQYATDLESFQQQLKSLSLRAADQHSLLASAQESSAPARAGSAVGAAQAATRFDGHSGGSDTPATHRRGGTVRRDH